MIFLIQPPLEFGALEKPFSGALREAICYITVPDFG
jgi:hypothetical protein